MHHVVVESWSRRASWLHSRDARAKIVALLALLIGIAGARFGLPLAAYGFFVAVAAWTARLPLGGLLLRAALVLPFAAAVAIAAAISGDAARAYALIAKSYASALAALLLAATTPLPRLLEGAARLGAPRFVVLVVQFLYRYLFVISEQAQHMRLAAASRGASSFRAATGAVSVLFARSYARAEAIHRAMLARGFNGRIPDSVTARFTAADAALVVSAVALAMLPRWL